MHGYPAPHRQRVHPTTLHVLAVAVPAQPARRAWCSVAVLPRLLLPLFLLLLAWLPLLAHAVPLPSGLTGMTFTAAQKLAVRETVREMFEHGYQNYLKYAHPHDELKPLSRSWTDSLAELGNAPRARDGQY